MTSDRRFQLPELAVKSVSPAASPETGPPARSSPANSPPGRTSTLPGRLLAGLALLLAVVALVQHWRVDGEKQLLEQRLVQAGIGEPESLARLQAEPTLAGARLLTARLVVHRVISATETERPAAAALLPLAKELAAEVLRAQPGDWQASMLLGTATYLEWSLTQNRRLFTEAAAWEKPLQHSIELAPGHLEPKRLLATAYLEVWFALSPTKKTLARGVLREVFSADQRAYRALLPAFVAVTPDFEEIFDVIPSEPEAWQDVERIYSERRAFGALAAARERYLQALEARIEKRYAEAEERIGLGDFYRSRYLLLKNLAEAPPSARFAPHVARALELYPPGLHGLTAGEPLRGWLDWLLELDRLGLHPIEPRLVGRLLDAVGEIDPAKGAHAALVAGDLNQAERYSRLSEAPQVESWGPYLIARAHQEIDKGLFAEARQSLDMVYFGTQRQAPYLLARLKLAQALGDAGGINLARAELARQQKQEWEPLDWKFLGNRRRLELLPSRAARGLTIEIQDGPNWGSVIEVLLDGRSLKTAVVQNGHAFRLEVPIEARLHLLEIEPLMTANVVPGRVRLLD